MASAKDSIKHSNLNKQAGQNVKWCLFVLSCHKHKVLQKVTNERSITVDTSSLLNSVGFGMFLLVASAAKFRLGVDHENQYC